MRIHVNVDDEVFEKAMKFSQLSTKKAVIETALNFYVQMQAQQKIRELRGKLHWGWDDDDKEQTEK